MLATLYKARCLREGGEMACGRRRLGSCKGSGSFSTSSVARLPGTYPTVLRLCACNPCSFARPAASHLTSFILNARCSPCRPPTYLPCLPHSQALHHTLAHPAAARLGICRPTLQTRRGVPSRCPTRPAATQDSRARRDPPKSDSADLPYTLPRQAARGRARQYLSSTTAAAPATTPLTQPAPRRAVKSEKSRRRRAYPQQIVTTRLLYCLQDPFAQLSRLQRI